MSSVTPDDKCELRLLLSLRPVGFFHNIYRDSAFVLLYGCRPRTEFDLRTKAFDVFPKNRLVLVLRDCEGPGLEKRCVRIRNVY